MPPPNRTVRRPTVNKPVPQRNLNGSGVTSTDTWNKSTPNLQVTPSSGKSALTSTKSNVPGVVIRKENNVPTKPQPPRRTSGGSSGTVKRTGSKPLPGAKLRPLHSNQREPAANNTKVVGVTGDKAKLNQPSPPSVASMRTDQVTPSSRSSSVSSIKPVLPRISQVPSPSKAHSSDQPAESEEKQIMTEENKAKHVPELGDLKTQAMKLELQILTKLIDIGGAMKEEKKKVEEGSQKTKRHIRTAKLRKAAEAESKQTDQVTDYYMPDWYKDPLTKPAQVKGGISVFIMESNFPNGDESYFDEPVMYYNLRQMTAVKDIRLFLKKVQETSVLTLWIRPKQDEKGEESEEAESKPAELDKYPYPPPSLSKELGLKANEILGEELYVPAIHDPEVYHLSTHLSDLQMTWSEDVVSRLREEIKFEEYAQSIATELGIKTVSTKEEYDTAIVKAQKKKANIQKQERATHGQYYIEPFEIEDVWNHVNTCHVISESAFIRTELIKEVSSAVKADLGTTSSPLIIRGESKTGKTWLCAQIPGLMDEKTLTIVRICSLTCLSSSLPQLLRNITKQLHVHYRSAIIPRVVQASHVDLAELFLDILRQISQAAAEKPVVIVLDGFDKLASTSVELAEFLSQCIGSVPTNVSLVVSLTSPHSDKSEFYDPLTGLTSEEFQTEMVQVVEEKFDSLVDLVGDNLEVFEKYLLEKDDAKPLLDAGMSEERLEKFSKLGEEITEILKSDTKTEKEEIPDDKSEENETAKDPNPSEEPESANGTNPTENPETAKDTNPNKEPENDEADKDKNTNKEPENDEADKDKNTNNDSETNEHNLAKVESILQAVDAKYMEVFDYVMSFKQGKKNTSEAVKVESGKSSVAKIEPPAQPEPTEEMAQPGEKKTGQEPQPSEEKTGEETPPSEEKTGEATPPSEEKTEEATPPSEEKTGEENPQKEEKKELSKEELEAIDEMFAMFSETLSTIKSIRKTLQKDMRGDIEKLKEYIVEDGEIFQLINVDKEENRPQVIVTTDFCEDQAKEYISHISKGKLSEKDCAALQRVVDYVHNPLLLKLVVNRCYTGYKPDRIVEMMKMVSEFPHNDENLDTFLRETVGETEADPPKHGFIHLAIANAVMMRGVESEKYQDLSWMRTNQADLTILRPEPSMALPGLLNEFHQNMDGCMLSVYEQNDFLLDGEHVETFLRKGVFKEAFDEDADKGAMLPVCLRTEMGRAATMLLERNHLIAKYGFAVDKKEMVEESKKTPELLGEMFQDGLKNEINTSSSSRHSYSLERIAGSFKDEPHEADTWDDVNVLNKEALQEDFTEDFMRLPVTSSKEKGYPQGRRKVHIINMLEVVASSTVEAVHSADNAEVFTMFYVIEILLQYDFLIPLLQEFGVDYVANSYGSLLEILLRHQEMTQASIQNLLPLEVLQNLLTKYTPQLRENVNNFFVLFSSMFNEDTALTSQAAMRLYRRVMHEVDIRNSLHCITLLCKTSETQLLSEYTKRYLQSTSNKYAACQCISNASYILSHNNNDQVKLWELTGEFISAQKFEGHIKAVCPQREAKCFLAVIETVSEVGQKNASVWRIDRLKNKKLTDVGSKHILSAWFNADGTKLVLVEQCTADEIRLVISMPQSMMVSLTDNNVITIKPISRTSFMDKTLELPRKIDDKLMELMGKHIDVGTVKQPDAAKSKAITVANQPLVVSDLETLWDDILEKFDAKDDLVYPMEEISAEIFGVKESISKMKGVTLHGMTAAGDIVVDLQYSDETHDVLFYKLKDDKLTLKDTLAMDDQATMTLMPTDDFVYSDTGHNSGLISWNLPTNDKKVFGNEQSLHVTCLQFEVEEGQILSFTRGQVTVWNAVQKTTESSFTLDKGKDVVAACLQDNWLAIANREGELTIRYEIRKKMATYHFNEPIDWIDCHVIGDYLYVACHLNGEKPGICFLKYRVSDAPLYELEKYVVRS